MDNATCCVLKSAKKYALLHKVDPLLLTGALQTIGRRNRPTSPFRSTSTHTWLSVAVADDELGVGIRLLSTACTYPTRLGEANKSCHYCRHRLYIGAVSVACYIQLSEPMCFKTQTLAVTSSKKSRQCKFS